MERAFNWMTIRSLLVAIALMAGFIPAVGATKPDPYIIYVIDPLSGPNAYFGQQLQRVLQLYENVANNSGGIKGQPIHFQFLDDESKAQVAVELFGQLAAKHVPAILGPDSQSECRAVLPLTSHGPVVYCFTPGIFPPPGYLFSAAAGIDHTEHVLLKYAHDSGAKRLALLVETDATGQSSDKLLPQTLAKPDLAGMDVVVTQHFEPSALSVSAQVASIKAANPQYLYVSATGTPFQTVLRGLIDGGLNIPVVTSSANMDLKVLTPFGTSLPPLAFNAPPSWNVAAMHDKPLKAVVDAYQGAYKSGGGIPSPNDEMAWDPASIIVASLRKLGTSATADQIHDFIENLHDFPGLGGYYDFRTGNQHGLGEDAVIVVSYDSAHQRFIPVSKPGGEPLASHP